MEIKCGFQHESYKHAYERTYMSGGAKKYNAALLREKTIAVNTAKNDFAAFQLLLTADTAVSVTIGYEPYFSTRDVRDNLRVAVSGLPFEMTLSHIGAVRDDDGIRKADILLHDATVEIDPDEICCIWAEAAIGTEIAAGTYEGKIEIYTHRMFETETLAQSLPFTVTVYDITLPPAQERSFYLDLWQHNSNIARKHETPLYGDAHFAALESYIKSLGALGQKAITIVASEIPWSGQRCFFDPQEKDDLFEYSMIRVWRDRAGEYQYDFSVMQRYIDLCFRYGIKDEIEVFGLCNIWACDDEEYSFMPKGYPEYIRVRYFDEAAGTYGYISDADGIRAYIRALGAYFIEKGYIDIVRIVADEPADMERYHKSVDAVREAVPQFQYKTAVNHREFIEEFKDKVSDFVPGLFCVAKDHDLLREMADAGSHRIAWYVCCMPKVPNTYICSHLLEARAIGYLTDYLGYAGFLRWNYTVWPDEPRKDLRYRYPDWRCGDTNFVYPSRGGEALLSLRYKALLRGILDYELLQMAKKQGQQALVDEIVERIIKIKSPQDMEPLDEKKADDLVSLTAQDYEWARKQLLTQLNK